jgi:hypothetical protein
MFHPFVANFRALLALAHASSELLVSCVEIPLATMDAEQRSGKATIWFL